MFQYNPPQAEKYNSRTGDIRHRTVLVLQFSSVRKKRKVTRKIYYLQIINIYTTKTTKSNRTVPCLVIGLIECY